MTGTTCPCRRPAPRRSRLTTPAPRRCSAGRPRRDRTGLTGEVLIPLIEGLHAFARGEWKQVVERIEPIRPRLIALGGSRAQRDVFHDTYLEACFRAGDQDRARRFVEERVLRRPDRYWVNRRAA